MQNDYNKTIEKGADFARSAVNQGEDKIKDMAGNAQKQFKQVQEQAGQIMGTVDKQVRENPWPIIAGVAVGSFLLGTLIGRSNK